LTYENHINPMCAFCGIDLDSCYQICGRGLTDVSFCLRPRARDLLVLDVLVVVVVVPDTNSLLGEGDI
jgi:hypothetical protein